MFRILLIASAIVISGCANIPQESVTLSKEIATGITSIHESNTRFVNQYFEVKSAEIDKYEKEALDDFFHKIAEAMTKKDAPPLEYKNMYDIKAEVEKIHAAGTKFKNELDASKTLIIEKLQSDYNLIISANSSITGLLQSAVDIDKAKNDGLSKIKELTNGKIDLTDIDSEVNAYLAEFGSSSTPTFSLIKFIQEALYSTKGE